MSPETIDLVEKRRREATKAMVRYFLVAFFLVAIVTLFTAYAVYNAAQRRGDRTAIRIEFCQELENLKKQNREDVAIAKRQYARNLKLLHLQDTPELRKAAEAGWAHRLEENKAKKCPYTGNPVP